MQEPVLQELRLNCRFDKVDSTILKGYGILIMIFHHIFGLYALPQGIDTAWLKPWPNSWAWYGKICVGVFLFITGYALAIRNVQRKGFLAYCRSGLRHYGNFYKVYLPCLAMALLITCLLPTAGLPQIEHITLPHRILMITGIEPHFADWWYMGAFALATLVMYPVCALICHKLPTLWAMATLVFLSFWLDKRIDLDTDNMIWKGLTLWWNTTHLYMPCFVLGYMCACLSKPFTNKWTHRLGATLIMAQLGVIHAHCFHLRTMTVLFVFVIWCMPWLTRKLHVTGVLALLGSYSALMWLNHRFVFGYHFCADWYAIHNPGVLFALITACSLMLAMMTQKMFDRLFKVRSDAFTGMSANGIRRLFS